jgi:hypothetical protein
MLHSNIYNNCITPELRNALRNRDSAILIETARLHIDALSQMDPSSCEFQDACIQLHVTLAFLDAIRNGGQTVSLMIDVINL